MSVEEITAETVKLSPQDRLALLRTLQSDHEVGEAWLKAEIMKGIEDLERGDYLECRNDEELRAYFEGVKVRGRERLAARSRAAA